MTVLATNRPPIAVDDVATSPEDTLLPITAAAFASNDTDPDPQPLTIISAQNPVNGTIVDVGGVPQFSPTPNYSGPASFEYVVSDGLATDVGLVAVTVTPVNDLPVATDDATNVAEDAAATAVDVVANCYVSFDDEMLTFGAAQTACIASGGHLATITSSGEQTLVASVQNPAQNP